MSVEVFLMNSVADLGVEGNVVRVKDGYARNFLFPRGLAAPVTEATRRQLAKLQREREAARKEQEAAAKEMAAKLAGVSVTLAAKTSDGEHLYGSVDAAMVSKALEAQGFVFGRDAIEIAEPIKELGVYEIGILLPAGAKATIKAWVVEE